MANLNDFTKKNPIFTGNTGIRIPVGTSADRDATANNAATFRYNQDIGGVEFYGPTGWVPLAAPPSISSVTPGTFDGESGTEFTINGSNFNSDAQVYFITSNSTQLLASTVTYIGPGQLRATTPRNILVQEEPLDVRVTQASGSVTRINAIDAGGLPIWVTTAGTLGSVFGANVVNVYVTATEPDETAITYTITSGSLPTGLSLTSANGLIQGLANSVLANTTYNFTIKASDTVSNNTDRTFSYTIQNRRPVINTAAGSLGTFYSGNAVPSTTIDAYDPDGGQVQFQVSSGNLPANTTLGLSTGTISGTPIVVNANTTYTFEVSANDEGSLIASNTYSFTVLNRFPVWNTAAGSIADISDAQIDSYTPITVNAYDPDGQVVSYQLTSGSVPAGLTFVTANAAIAGVPESVESNTTSTFTVTASDGSNGTAREFTMTVRLPIDPFFANTVLLLHGNGSASSNGNLGFADSSNNNFAVTVVGDAYESSFSPFSVAEGQWSNFFDGTGDYHSLSLTDSNIGIIGVRDGTTQFVWTIECWIYPTSSDFVIAQRASNSVGQLEWYLYHNNTTGISWHHRQYGSSDRFAYSNVVLPLNQWHHVVQQKEDNSTWVFYINGVKATTSYGAGGTPNAYGDVNLQNNSGFVFGGTTTGTSSAYYMSNFRFTQKIRYSGSTIAVPTSPFSADTGTSFLTCQSNRFKDSSTNNFTITRNGDVLVSQITPFSVTPNTVDGSGYFDGTGDYILSPTNNAVALGSGDFTLELWAYCLSASDQALYEGRLANLSATGFTLTAFNATTIRTFSSGVLLTGTVPNYLNQWTHIAVCRSSGTSRLFVNGTLIASGSDSTNYTDNRAVIGSGVYGGSLGGGSINAFISNFRLIKGTALYTSAFTPPTSSLNVVTNTQLLTCKYQGATRNVGFIDSSNFNHRFVRNGNTTQGSFSPFSKPERSWSNYFDQSGDYFTFTGNSSTNFSGVDWCIESWVYLDKSPSTLMPVIFSQTGTNNWVPYIGFGINSSRNIYAAINATGNTSTETVPLNSWNHIAMVRSGGIVKVYLNGVATSISITSDINNSNLNFWIGYIGPPAGVTEQFGGYLSNLRVVKGSAVYTSNFTPSGPLTAITNTSLLTCQSNRFIDNSTNNFTITPSGNVRVTHFSPFSITTAYDPVINGGSAYFDGTGDNLRTLGSVGTALGTTPFCVEIWIHPTSIYDFLTAISTRENNGTFATGWGMGIRGNGELVMFGSADILTSPAGLMKANQWYHVVFCRNSSNNTALFANGVRVAYSASITTNYSLQRIGIGDHSVTNAEPFTGYISQARIVKGESVYDPTQTTLTVPTSPVSLTANTTLLCNFTNAGIFDNTGFSSFESVGNAQIDTSVKKYGTGAIKFDGDDYLLLPPSPTLEFGSENFTIEFWWYPTSTVRQALYHGSFGTDWSIGIDYSSTSTNQKIGIWASSNGSSWNLINADGGGNGIGITTVTQNSWNHIAYVRNGTTWMLFVNGNRDLNLTGISGSIVNRITSHKGIGVWYSAAAMSEVNGYLDEFRITKGVARYTSNFTPRSRAFPNR